MIFGTIFYVQIFNFQHFYATFKNGLLTRMKIKIFVFVKDVARLTLSNISKVQTGDKIQLENNNGVSCIMEVTSNTTIRNQIEGFVNTDGMKEKQVLSYVKIFEMDGKVISNAREGAFVNLPSGVDREAFAETCLENTNDHNQCPVLIKLTAENIRKVSPGDKLRLKTTDGSFSKFKVTDNKQEASKIEGKFKVNGKKFNRIFPYEDVFKQDGHVKLEDSDDVDKWNERLCIPVDLPLSETSDERTVLIGQEQTDQRNDGNFSENSSLIQEFLEMIKRGYIDAVNFIKVTQNDFDVLLEQNIPIFSKILKQHMTGAVKRKISVWKMFLLSAWRKRAMTVKGAVATGAAVGSVVGGAASGTFLLLL